jgi:hypothetical protein
VRRPASWGRGPGPASARAALGALAYLAAVGLAAAGCGPGRPAQPRVARPGPPPPTGPASPHRIVYGADLNQFDKDIGPARVPAVLSLVSQASGSAVRAGVPWSQVEPRPGQLDFSGVDRLLSLARQRHLSVLFELGEEPAWDAVGHDPAAPPADCASPQAPCSSVISYVKALVAHGAPEGLSYLVVRNEPQNFAKNWVGGTPTAYARFQQAVYQAAHQASPGIEVLNGGTEALPPALAALRDRLEPQGPYAKQAAAFAQALYSDPVWCRSIDVLDLHVGDHGPIYSPQIVQGSEAALEACDGGRALPVWVTEVAYPSIPALQDSPLHRLEVGSAYTGGEAGQARFLTDTFAALARLPQVVGVNWTFVVDPNVSAPNPSGPAAYRAASDTGAGDGLVYATLRPKASYLAFKQVASSAS